MGTLLWVRLEIHTGKPPVDRRHPLSLFEDRGGGDADVEQVSQVCVLNRRRGRVLDAPQN
jgi:hypothetical protein